MRKQPVHGRHSVNVKEVRCSVYNTCSKIFPSPERSFTSSNSLFKVKIVFWLLGASGLLSEGPLPLHELMPWSVLVLLHDQPGLKETQKKRTQAWL